MTTVTATAAERCTTILLQEILDYLSLRDLLHAMAVKRLWREHVVNHPTYYGQLFLFPSDPPACAKLLLLRLSRSAGRPVLVVIEWDDLYSFMPEIANHLGHIYSLTLRQPVGHSECFAPVLGSLCRPADILRDLSLEANDGPTELPGNLLAGHAPALQIAHLRNITFSGTLPRYLAGIGALIFLCDGLSGQMLTLPSAFERCPDLRRLWLGNCVRLDDTSRRVHQFWESLSELTFSGFIGTCWPTFRLPIAAVPMIHVERGDAASALALADTILGPLHVTFPPPYRVNVSNYTGHSKTLVFYKVVLRSLSDADIRLRRLEGQLDEGHCISAFSFTALTNRIARITLALSAWTDYVGLGTFGPFPVLEELDLTLNADVPFPSEPGLPTLSCPRLRRLVLSGQEREQLTVHSGDAEGFAASALSDAKYPLELETVGVGLNGVWNESPKIFTSCVSRIR